MSGYQYLSNNKTTLFSVEDDVDDEDFLRHPPSGKMGYMMDEGSTENTYSPSLQDLNQAQLDKKKKIHNRLLESSQRSLSLLRNSEEIGISTAEELFRQREQLERTEKRLDEINTTLRFSQKHLKGIKSAFGSFKNYISGKMEQQQVNSSKMDVTTSNSSTKLMEVVGSTKPAKITSDIHPALRVRGLLSETRFDHHSDEDYEEEVDKNLSEMVSSITRLKGLAQGLGEELDSQNDLVENIISKTDRADITLKRQNKDISKLLD